MNAYTHVALSNIAGAVQSDPDPRQQGDTTLPATGIDDRSLDSNNPTWNNLAFSSPYLLIRNGHEAACYRMPLAKDTIPSVASNRDASE
jgi:hypothetical protein